MKESHIFYEDSISLLGSTDVLHDLPKKIQTV